MLRGDQRLGFQVQDFIRLGQDQAQLRTLQQRPARIPANLHARELHAGCQDAARLGAKHRTRRQAQREIGAFPRDHRRVVSARQTHRIVLARRGSAERLDSVGQRAVMNRELFPHGIQTENSDIRAHVSVVNRTIYVFKTRAGNDAVATRNPPTATAGQPGVDGVTADGWLTPIEWIDDLRRVRYFSWPRWNEFLPELATTDKGALAVACVIDAMRLGRFPIWLEAVEDERENIQIKGTD